ncbi:MAG: hypothetical protein A3F18_07810 [Legionellales bacterium RIFCSPHIGHO2_12_FULL_37_14]|nr:MAG: hypothetical protein A3F18_07810 [Legionellales bacterium RIFCSPHIGHO2_12_FULL_37_14]
MKFRFINFAIKLSFNPFKDVFGHKYGVHGPTLSSPFILKMIMATDIIGSLDFLNFYQINSKNKETKFRLGLFDYLTFGTFAFLHSLLHAAQVKVQERYINSYRNGLFFPIILKTLLALHFLLDIPRLAFTLAAGLVALPIVAIVHGISTLVKNAKLKHFLTNIKGDDGKPLYPNTENLLGTIPMATTTYTEANREYKIEFRFESDPTNNRTVSFATMAKQKGLFLNSFFAIQSKHRADMITNSILPRISL